MKKSQYLISEINQQVFYFSPNTLYQNNKKISFSFQKREFRILIRMGCQINNSKIDNDQYMDDIEEDEIEQPYDSLEKQTMSEHKQYTYPDRLRRFYEIKVISFDNIETQSMVFQVQDEDNQKFKNDLKSLSITENIEDQQYQIKKFKTEGNFGQDSKFKTQQGPQIKNKRNQKTKKHSIYKLYEIL
ncbi:hypothetical protein pb186bvf_002836 [Paramecium bursaria]